MNINVTSERIKELRTSMNMTLEELGNKVGVSKSTVLRWESGEIRRLTQGNIVQLSAALNCSPLYLLGMSDFPNWIREIESLNLNGVGTERLLEYARFLASKKENVNESR